ncbi:EAL domain-containing protein [Nocardioides panacisoli]|uniref:sensor domain-containing protein n=1 Tax=Nocardioides panacisoli TaxID=627624 RepID=UPI001C6300C9|nr:EAL domain-containing protein [Nocardioides panacisoli]QYJ05087.1 EAL domain-containing protein [Nocardioides panacisoli]
MSALLPRSSSLLHQMRPAESAPTRPSWQTALPFVLVAIAGLGSVFLPPYESDKAVELVIVAVGFFVALGLLAVAISRDERSWVDPAPAFLFFLIYAAARDAGGGADSGIAPIIVLPILWLALTGTRRDLIVSAVLTACVLGLPLLLIGAPAYPDSEWRRAVLWTAVAALIAPVIQRLVAELARHRSLAEEASSENEAILRGARQTKIISYDLDGIIRSYSAGAQELLGYAPETLIGKQGPEFLHDPDEVARVAAELGVEPGFAVFRTLAETRAPGRVWTYRTATGETLFMQLVVTELVDAAGERTGYLGVAIDVTAAERAERELAEAEGRWRTLLEHLPDTVVMMLDEDLVIRAVGGQSATKHGLQQQAIGRHLAEFSRPENMAVLRQLTADALEGHEGHAELVATSDGSEQEVLVSPLPDGTVEGAILLVARDVSRERARAREAEEARERAEGLFADAPHGVAVVRPDGTVVRANQSMGHLLGREAATLVGQPMDEYAGPGAESIAPHLHEAVRRSPALITADWSLRTTEGETIHVAISGRRLAGVADGDEDLVVVNVVDVSERLRYEQRLAHLADHDPLTGLANRRKFDEELQRHHEFCDRYGATGAILLLDLDQFKEVNDSLGHGAGDQLIISTAALLRTSVRGTDVVARLGGDEFAVLLTEGDRETAATVGAKLVDRIGSHTATLDSTRRNVTVSIGGVTFADAADSDADILSLADMMMYDAKEDGRNRCLVFDRSRYAQPRMGARMEWRSRIERALENDDFALHLQPIQDLHHGGIRSAEVLIRLADSDELVPPGRFLYIAERAGLAPALDAWVIRHSLPLLQRLRAIVPDFALEVNLSGHSIGEPLIERTITDELTRLGVDPSSLILEITETAAVADVEMARAFAERMSALGCKFALDDFGAGFGSFYYLKHLLFDYVKIDGEFVANCHRSAVDRLILHSIVGIAHDLGKQTVAEFVADPDILEVVGAEGVDLAQGFHIGKPVPYDEFVSVLDRSATTSTGATE